MPHTRPRIGIDFDDVIADFNGWFVQYMNKQLGTSHQYNDITRFELDQVYGLPAPQVLQHIERFCHDHHWHGRMRPFPNTGATLRSLATQYELVIVTSRCESLVSITSEWLYAWGLPQLSAVHCTNGSSTRFAKRRRQKSAVCRELEVSVFIDDALHNATDVAAAGIPVLLKNRP